MFFRPLKRPHQVFALGRFVDARTRATINSPSISSVPAAVKLVFSEGGQGIVPPPGRTPTYLAALNDAQIDTAMRTLYLDLFRYLRDATAAC